MEIYFYIKMNDLATLILHHFGIPFPSRQLLELKYRCIWNFLITTNMHVFGLRQLAETVFLYLNLNFSSHKLN